MKYLKPGDLITVDSKNYATEIWPLSQVVCENYGNGYIKIRHWDQINIVREEECTLIEPWDDND